MSHKYLSLVDFKLELQTNVPFYRSCTLKGYTKFDSTLGEFFDLFKFNSEYEHTLDGNTLGKTNYIQIYLIRKCNFKNVHITNVLLIGYLK